MALGLNIPPSPILVKPDPSQAAHTLAKLLCQAPEYCAFLDALKALNSNLTIQKLSAEVRSHQTALKWGQDAEGQHVAELTRLELEMADHPAVKRYQQAEGQVNNLLRAVDEIISSEAGMPFAVNAQRTTCSCGG